ncbi:glycosyl hydrolase [Nocardioides renjunii]|uniref:glycosyl hydrolase n=1 Tax=Nocardioides renjunii TaxID=3095075 RepID=UPI002ACC127F|nr:glycosyl hydrolase [Nocardioides sp. S-58]
MALSACSSDLGDATAPPSRSGSGSASPPGGDSAPLPASEIEPLVAALPELSLAPLPEMRLADGLTPPTNRWFSGLVFGEEPQPVFPLPLAFSMDDTSFGAGLPQVVTSETAIVGSHQQDVSVEVGDAATTVVAAYDDASVTLETRDADDRPLGRTTIAQGSPYVTHVAVADETLTTSTDFAGSGAVVTAETASGPWGMRLDGAELDGDTFSLGRGDSIVLFPVPEEGDLDAMAEHAVPLTGTTSSYSVGADEVTTTITYEADGTSAVAVMPHQSGAVDGACRLGTFPSVYGSLTLCAGSTLTWSAPRVRADGALDLSGLSNDDREELAAQVARDVDDLPDAPADTYFGGKWLYRTSQLMTIAEQVGAEAPAREARAQLVELLRTWTQPDGCLERSERCFGYDPAWKGVMGQTAAFGSELLNDHHFHYGYFLYAAAVVSEADPSLVDELAPVMTLLAADIAGGADTGTTPKWRPFDVYASHSWASGTSDFADGNNQESSSEAVTAWAGLLLWARAAGDEDLERQAEWMLGSEAHAATTYWTNFDTSEPVYDGFEHTAIGINWGGKRDYATWFSPEPSAILGIQLIPMSPSSGYLAEDPDRITANVEEAGDGPLGDYALMYAGLAGASEAASALEQARALPGDAIDQGSSRSYMLAFLMIQAASG